MRPSVAAAGSGPLLTSMLFDLPTYCTDTKTTVPPQTEPPQTEPPTTTPATTKPPTSKTLTAEEIVAIMEAAKKAIDDVEATPGAVINGVLTLAELKAFLNGCNLTDEQIGAIFDAADVSPKDGEVTLFGEYSFDH